MRDEIFHILNNNIINLINQKEDNFADRQLEALIVEEALVKVEELKRKAYSNHEEYLVIRINMSLLNLLKHFDHENFYYANDTILSDIYGQIMDILYNDLH